MGRKCDLKNPKTFNEKLNYLKLHDHNPLYPSLVDKASVREYVKEKIGKEYLVPMLGLWDSADDIDFDALPSSFVLKCTHDSASFVLCPDKSNFDKEAAIAKLNEALKVNYYYETREWVYKDLTPRIIAEEFLEDNEDKELRDYKIFCFNGEPKLMYIATDRAIHETKFDFFDMDFNHIDMRQHYPNSEKILHKPKNFELMKELASKLSAGLKHVRVDFYEVNGRVYFGEMTFYNNCGMTPIDPIEWDYKIGEWLET